MVMEDPAVPLPGANKPPLLTIVLPTVPLPVSMAPLPTVVRLDEAIEPMTTRAPPVMLVAPV
jgi:hypothetical protein